MIFIDTGLWIAMVHPKDKEHEKAKEWFRHNESELITSDYVIDETLTFLRAKKANHRAISLGELVFTGEHCKVHFLTESEIISTWEVFQRYSDKEWSFTDCSSKVIMDNLGIEETASFDKHFEQFGRIRVVI